MFRGGFSFMTLDYRAKKCIKTYNYPWGPVLWFKGLKGSFNLCVVLIMFCLKRFWVVKLRSLGNQAGPTTLNWWTHCFAVCLDYVQGADLVWPVNPAWNSDKTTLNHCVRMSTLNLKQFALERDSEIKFLLQTRAFEIKVDLWWSRQPYLLLCTYQNVALSLSKIYF